MPAAATEPAPAEPDDRDAGRSPAPSPPRSSRSSSSRPRSPRRPPWPRRAPGITAAATAAQRLIRVARRQLGDRYVYGAAGPRRFDCSGLVLYSLRHSHSRRIASLGGRSADSFYAAYRRHHRVGRHHGHPGDLVIWGGGRHIGIYLGQGRAISALTRRGVSVHGLHAVTMPFNGFLHTRLWRHR